MHHAKPIVVFASAPCRLNEVWGITAFPLTSSDFGSLNYGTPSDSHPYLCVPGLIFSLRVHKARERIVSEVTVFTEKESLLDNLLPFSPSVKKGLSSLLSKHKLSTQFLNLNPEP